MIKTALVSVLTLRGLITIPGVIALLLWGTAPLLQEIDQAYPDFSASGPFTFLHTPYDTATTTLAAIATAAISTLALVYSLVLLVFTLAAGTIAPRLLRRFTNDRVNQITAGLFGGTFLYSLTVLHQTAPDFVPAISISVALALAAISVLQLVYFVHSVSRSVTIDEEIAQISEQLEKRLDRIVRSGRGKSPKRHDLPGERDLAVTSRASGYVSLIDSDGLVKLAARRELFVDLTARPGEFVLAGQTFAHITGTLEDRERAEVEDAIRTHVSLSPSRGSVEDIEFAVSILLEIALRALSPGLNDTFTAIACVDRLSAALAEPVAKGLRDHVRTDSDGAPRLHIPGLTLEDLLNSGFHPLRRAASNNLLMLQNIADALIRLHEIAADDEPKALLRNHARLLIDTYKSTDPLPVDFEFLQDRLAPLLED